MFKCEDEIIFATNKENETIKCLRFKVVLNLSESNTVENKFEKIVDERRKE